MQKTLYMTEETWRQLQHITGEDRSYSDIIRELIYLEYERRMHEEAGGPLNGMEKK